MSKTSAAVKNRYNAKAYDRFQIYLPKGYKDRLRAIVGKGGSITNYIKEAIDAKMKEDHWISVSTALPEKDGSYLAYDPNDNIVFEALYIRDREDCAWTDPDEEWCNFTGISHWKPLPDPPSHL